MTQLIKYEAACRALAECKAVDEVKDLHDKAAAMQAYGRMAKDKTLEVDAAEIRIRAERRLGEMLVAQKQEGGFAKPGPKSVVTDDRSIRLADAGISKDLSSRAQKLAAVPEAEFEAEVGEWRERVQAETARVTTRLEKAGEKHAPADDFGPDAEELAADAAGEQADREAVALILASDEPLAEMMVKNKILTAQVAALTLRIAGLQNANNEHIRTIKGLRRKLEKMEQAA